MRPGTRVGRAAAWSLAVLAALAFPDAGALAQEGAVPEAAAVEPDFHPLRADAPHTFTTSEGDPVTQGGTGRCRLFALTPTRDGLITITAESLDGDAYIRLVEPGPAPRKVLVADDDGGIEWNPRLVVETKAGEPLYLDVGFKILREGTLTVKVAAGEVPALQGDELEEARLAFFEAQETLLQDESRRLDLAQNLNKQTDMLWRLEEWEACLELSRRLLAMGEELSNTSVLMIAEGRLGASLGKLGRSEEAAPHLRRSVAHAVELRHAPFEMFAQRYFGQALLDLDALDESRQALERAHLIAKAMGDDDNRKLLATELGMLGKQYELHGAFAEALDIYERTRDSALELGDRDTECVALARTAQVMHALGMYEQAHEKMLEALVVSEEGVREGLRMQFQLQLAGILSDQGRADEAREALEGSLRLATAELSPAIRGRLYSMLTRLYYETGDLELARERADSQAKLGRVSGDVAVEAVGINNLAFLELRSGEFERAAELSSRAVELLSGEAFSERIAVMGTRVEIALAMRDADVAGTLLAELEELGAQVGSDSLGIEVASMARATSRWALIGEYQQELVNLQMQGRDARTDGDREFLVAGFRRIGRWRSRALLETMAQRRTQALGQFEDILPADLRRSVLPTDGMLVHYVDGLDRIYAYCVTADDLGWHDLGPRGEVLGETRAFLDGISDPKQLAAPDVVARTGGALFDRLLRPVLAGQERGGPLVVVPTPSLAGLPFEALVMAAPEDPRGFDEFVFVMDRQEISYAPSAPVLGLLASVGPRAERGGGLVLADPDYSTLRQTVIPAANRALPPLPGTRSEALAIARLMVRGDDSDRLQDLDGRPDVRLDLDGIEIALGKEVTASMLDRDLSDYSVLHFAMHGVIDEGDARRSGLVLSSSGNDDGFLSVDEIAGLRIDADLAVLSACDTARGEVRRGEGVQSMARALMVAGARSVVASLWQVDDSETQRIMGAFYTARQTEGASGAAALRAARMLVRHPGGTTDGFVGVGRGGALGGKLRQPLSGRDLIGHPYFWAAFVYVGLPR